MFYSHRVLVLEGGGRLGEEVSLTLAWEIHNHWSHGWALIRPAVSSLKGQKSILLQYRTGSVVISAHTSSPVWAHMRTHPDNTKTESVTWLSLCLMGLMFVFTDNVIEKRWVILWYKAFFWGRMQFPFFNEATKSLQYSNDDRGAHYRLQVMNYEPIFLDWLMYYFMFVLRTLPMRISHEATDHFLMFVCHNNMFMLMFVVVSLLFYWLYHICFVLVLTYLRKFDLQNYRPGLHSLFISGALCDQSVVFSCITCLCLTISVKLNKPF